MRPVHREVKQMELSLEKRKAYCTTKKREEVAVRN